MEYLHTGVIRWLEGDEAMQNATEAYEKAEEEHTFDAVTSLLLNLTIIVCLLLAYYVKKYRIYYLPESAGALLVGIVIGGIARLSTDKLELFEFVSHLVSAVLIRKSLCYPPSILYLSAPSCLPSTVPRGLLLCLVAPNHL